MVTLVICQKHEQLRLFQAIQDTFVAKPLSQKQFLGLLLSK